MSDSVRLRLVFVDGGEYHREEVVLPADALAEYERLIDFLREDRTVLQHLHVDLDRLCAAYRVDERGVEVRGEGAGTESVLPFTNAN